MNKSQMGEQIRYLDDALKDLEAENDLLIEALDWAMDWAFEQGEFPKDTPQHLRLLIDASFERLKIKWSAPETGAK